jgi:hypothetical protein
MNTITSFLKRSAAISAVTLAGFAAVASPAFALPSVGYTPTGPGPVVAGGTIVLSATPEPGCTLLFATTSSEIVFTFTAPDASIVQIALAAGTSLPATVTVDPSMAGWSVASTESDINVGQNCGGVSTEGVAGVKASSWDVAADAVTPVMPMSVALTAGTLSLIGFGIHHRKRSVLATVAT